MSEKKQLPSSLDKKEEQTVDYTVNTDPKKVNEDLFKVTWPMFFKHFEGSNTETPKTMPEDFKVIVVQGGITNLLYKCVYKGNEILVRIYGAKTEEVIDRKRENLIVNILSQQRFGPGIFGRFTNGRLEEWLPGKSLNPDLMVKENIVPRIARRAAQLHKLSLPLPREAGLWATLDLWLSKASAVKFEDNKQKAEVLKAIDLPTVAKELAALKQKIQASKIAGASPLVFAHNDMLSGNIMWDESKSTIELVDYEYGCYNFRGFDIANHFCECCGFDCDWKLFPTKEKQAVWLRAYLSASTGKDEKDVTDKEIEALYAEVQPYVLASHFFWGIWAIVQARFSPIDFDYIGYSKLRIQGYYAHKDACLKLL